MTEHWTAQRSVAAFTASFSVLGAVNLLSFFLHRLRVAVYMRRQARQCRLLRDDFHIRSGCTGRAFHTTQRALLRSRRDTRGGVRFR